MRRDHSGSVRIFRFVFDANGKKGRKTLACGGQSGFVFAQTAVDFAEIGEVVNITNCFHPVIFLAELVRRAHLTDGFSLEWIIDGVKTKGRCRKGQASITVGGSGDGLASHLTIYRDNNFRSQYSQMLPAKRSQKRPTIYSLRWPGMG